ncbi:MAG TPA: beta-N-acetylglucosaminidase domain-containing protein [Acidimicrobiales bacterium]
MGRAPARLPRCVVALVAVALAAGVACSGGDDGGSDDDGDRGDPTAEADPVIRDRSDPLPRVTPTPQSMRWLGPDVPVGGTVTLVADDGADEAATALVTDVLTRAGAEDVRRAGEDGADGDEFVGGGDDGYGLTVRLGPSDDPAIARALAAVGLTVPERLPPEGYALAAFRTGGAGDGGEDESDAGPGTIVLAADSPAGAFYAAQTLRQLAGDGGVAGVGVVDHPAMPLRGTIEGFYGSPWTHEERLDQLAFYGEHKLNTYVYAPKDDPYHRERWREPYPAAEVDRLRELVERAAANHVRFTFAVSPGVSICYSDRADTDALLAKLQALYDLGVRAFSVALDDIDHTRWNCEADAEAFGPASEEAAARAQVQLLNTVQRELVAARPDVHPLQMVPTEYRRTDDSPYRAVLRAELDPEIEVMWTGTLVVPPEITVEQAAAAAEVFGRRTLVWDNTPVNDFPPTEGRLLLAPYAGREPGLAAQVSGIVANPMNQAAASKVALIGVADFTWNDAAYDPARAHRAAAEYLAGAPAAEPDAGVVDALLAFFDLEHYAPTSGEGDAQPQAPALAARLDDFRRTWAGGDRAGAVAALRPYAELLAAAPERIRRGVVDEGFVSDCRPWLDATALWGRALVATLDGLDARARGDEAAAGERFAAAEGLAAEAATIHTIEGETRPQGPVRVGDGVLDRFVAEAHSLR